MRRYPYEPLIHFKGSKYSRKHATWPWLTLPRLALARLALARLHPPHLPRPLPRRRSYLLEENRRHRALSVVGLLSAP